MYCIRKRVSYQGMSRDPQNGGVVTPWKDIQEDYEAGYLDMRETLELF